MTSILRISGSRAFQAARHRAINTRLVASCFKKISWINTSILPSSFPDDGVKYQKTHLPLHCAPTSSRFRIAFAAMSAALRVPLRACANPATVIGQSFKPSVSTFTGALFHTHSKPVLRTSPVSCTHIVKSWGARQNWSNSISSTAKRSFATRTSSPPSAEASSLKSKAAEVKASPAQRNYVKYLVILGLLGAGAGAFAFSDNVQHVYGAAQRSGRVVGTLAVCINE